MLLAGRNTVVCPPPRDPWNRNYTSSDCSRCCQSRRGVVNGFGSNCMYSVSQKNSPLKLFAIFSLSLSIFPGNFANLLPVIDTYDIYQFLSIYLNI